MKKKETESIALKRQFTFLKIILTFNDDFLFYFCEQEMFNLNAKIKQISMIPMIIEMKKEFFL